LVKVGVVRIGFALPHLHQQAHDITRTGEFAREAEKAGAASLWVGDRQLVAVHPKVGAGGIGNTIPIEYRTPADPFVLLGVAAAATERVQLGTHVLVAPTYPPVQLARALTTIDVISGGRLVPGFGLGWAPEEYEAAGKDFTKRGAVMDELLDALNLLWSEDPVEYHGQHIELPLHHSPLKPVQRPRPPIYLGGVAEAALRRVGERGDGWMTLCMPPVWVDIDAMIAQRKTIDRFAAQAGRDPADIDTVLRLNIATGAPVRTGAEAIKTISERTGIDHFLIDSTFVADDVDASLEVVHEVMALVNIG
jgi:probable F420-dependent oxidoreductase